MSVRRSTAALLALCLVALVIGVPVGAAGGVPTPGEAITFEVPPICYRTALGAAATEGVMMRLCEPSAEESEGEVPERGGTLATVLPDGSLTKTAIPKAGSGPIVAAPDGTVWLAANAPEFDRGPAIVERIAPGGQFSRYEISAVSGGDTPHVNGLAVGPAGEAWASVGTGVRTTFPLAIGASRGGKLVRIAADGQVTSYPLPNELEPLAVVEEPDGVLWFTAVRKRLYEEHIYRPGSGYVGLLGPGRQLSLFPAPAETGALTSIALAKNGGVWVAGPELQGIDAVAPDGQFGAHYGVGFERPFGMVVGADGDAWIAAEESLIRVTPSGQRTWFDVPAAAVAAGAEGDIWAATETSIARVVPGAPGLDVRALTITRESRTAALHLACGGSASGCEGSLTMALTFHSRGHRPNGKVKWTYHSIAVAALPYAVGAEAEATVTADLPAAALALSGHSPGKVRGLRMKVTATVAAGPMMERVLAAPALAPPHRGRAR